MSVDDAGLAAIAREIQQADYLLIAAGAGFSADSGLPVYNDIARDPFYMGQGLTYADLADPKLLVKNRGLFWKFWSDCSKAYKETAAHAGYEIVNGWCASKGELEGMSRFYVYTSNVDGHFRRYDSLASSLCEMHGCVEESLCSSSMGLFAGGRGGSLIPRMSPLWEDWNGKTTAVQKEACRDNVYSTRKYIETEEPSYTDTDTIVHAPSCPKCSLPLRPSVMLFDDACPNVIKSVGQGTTNYQAWEDSMEARLRASGGKLVVLELGCGTRVPSVRDEVESVVRDVGASSGDGSASSCVTLVRINRDFPDIPYEILSVAPSSRGIQGNCLEILQALQRHMEGM